MTAAGDSVFFCAGWLAGRGGRSPSVSPRAEGLPLAERAVVLFQRAAPGTMLRVARYAAPIRAVRGSGPAAALCRGQRAAAGTMLRVARYAAPAGGVGTPAHSDWLREPPNGPQRAGEAIRQHAGSTARCAVRRLQASLSLALLRVRTGWRKPPAPILSGRGAAVRPSLCWLACAGVRSTACLWPPLAAAWQAGRARAGWLAWARRQVRPGRTRDRPQRASW